MSPDAPTVLAGAMTGLLVGLTGVGGGALMTPLLLLWFGVAPQVAVGTDLWFAAITKLAATLVYRGGDLVDWAIVGRVWAGSLPASAAVLLWLNYGLHERVSSVITMLVATAVWLTALALLFHGRLHLATPLKEASLSGPWQGRLTIASGSAIGVLASLTSIGAGTLGAVVLTRLYPTRLTPARLVATDVVQAIPLALFAAIGHTLLGNVDVRLISGLLSGSIPAVLFGATVSSRLPHKWLRLLLGSVLMFIGFMLAVTLT